MMEDNAGSHGEEIKKLIHDEELVGFSPAGMSQRNARAIYIQRSSSNLDFGGGIARNELLELQDRPLEQDTHRRADLTT